MRGLGKLAAVIGVFLVGGCFGFTPPNEVGPVKRSIGACSPYPCIAVDVAPLPELPSTLSTDARKVVDSELRRTLYAPLDVETGDPTLAGLLGELESRLKEYGEVSDASIDWTLTRTAALLYSDATVASFEVTNSGYLGGAHGFNERTLMTFDAQTGHRLGVADVVSDQSQRTLSKIVEVEFRRARSIQSEQTLQEAGFFLLPGQELPLGENFALTNKGIEIQYNPYEVAPYALGETRVSVPREAIAPLVKAELQGIFAENAGQSVSR